MLVLARRVGEVIRIGADIEIKVTRIRGKNVRLGIAAPRNIFIIRKELEDRDGGEENNERL